MAKLKLTKRAVEDIEPQPGRDVMVWDEALPGFGVRVKPSGVRSYVVQYRNAHGRSKRGTIGRHGKLTLEQARKEARQLFASVGTGGDPVAERKTKREAPTMNDLLDRYVADHLEVHNKPRTQEEFKRIVEKHIRPTFGALKAAGVTRDDVTKLHRSLAATPRLANTVLSVLSKMFNLAELWGMRPDGTNPVRLIKRYQETKRERFCTDEELGRLGAVLSNAEREQTEHSSVINAIRLLALTGCRLSEIISLQWDDIDLVGHKLTIRYGKIGRRLHVVGREAVALLAGLARLEGCPFVLPHTDLTKHLPDYTLKKAWRRIRAQAGLEDLRLHDLRHTVGTYAGQTGANAFLIRDKLGHATTAMTDQYVNHSHDPIRQLSDQVEDRIAAAMQGGMSTNDGAEIIPLHRKEA